MPATATKKRPAAEPIDRETICYNAQQKLSRRLDEAAAEDQARDEMMAELVHSHSAEELDSGPLAISRPHALIFHEMGCKNIHEIRRRLQQHRHTLELRAQVGDPSILAAAQARLDECKHAERTARAELEDIDNVAEGATPVLARQIANLERRLKTLVAAREAAGQEVASIELRRKQLSDRAPEWLKEHVGIEISAARASSSVCAEMQRIQPLFHSLRIVVTEFDRDRHHDVEYNCQPQQFDEKKFVYVQHARVHCPDMVRESHGVARVDESKFTARIEWLKTVEIPRLARELERLSAEWKSTVFDIEAPIRRWAETGRYYEN
jgi:hypothetical protein